MTAPSFPSNPGPPQAFGADLRDVRQRSPRTVQSYMGVAREFAAGAGVTDVARADVAAVTAFLDRGGASSVRAGRVRWNIELSALRALHRWSVETGQRTEDPTSGLIRHRVAILEAEPLRRDEMVRPVDAGAPMLGKSPARRTSRTW